jgi:hypothetical protein
MAGVDEGRRNVERHKVALHLLETPHQCLGHVGEVHVLHVDATRAQNFLRFVQDFVLEIVFKQAERQGRNDVVYLVNAVFLQILGNVFGGIVDDVDVGIVELQKLLDILLVHLKQEKLGFGADFFDDLAGDGTFARSQLDNAIGVGEVDLRDHLAAKKDGTGHDRAIPIPLLQKLLKKNRSLLKHTTTVTNF